MGLLSFVRSRTQVSASRAGNGAAAASSFIPKRETGVMPPSSDPKSSTPNPKRDTGYEPYTKNLYSSNEPEKKSPKGFHYGSGFGGADWSNQEPGRKGIDAI